MGKNVTKKRAPRREAVDPSKHLRKKPCTFCVNHTDWIDYKDVELLRRYVSDRAKIRARRVTGNCIQHQAQIATAVKVARELSLLPYLARPSSERDRSGRPRVTRGESRGPREEDQQSEVSEGVAEEEGEE